MIFVINFIILSSNNQLDKEKVMARQFQTVEGIYDGEKILPLQEIKTKNKYRLIITFLEEIDDLDNFKDLKLQSEKVFQRLWEKENDELWASYL